MKKTIFILTLFFTINTLLAQTWAPVGAIWYYSQATINPNLQSYKTIESLSDTIIQNKACKKMLETERAYNPVNYRTFFMYAANDSVFYYDNLSAEFCLLYDFNAQQGDTIFLDCFNLEVVVDSTDTVTLNGQLRKVQYISANTLGYSFWGANIEGIGNNIFMFPQGDMAMDGSLRCYQDSTGHINFMTIPCDSIIITSIDENTTTENFNIYPNPANKSIIIENKSQSSNAMISIYNLQGRLMLIQSLKQAKTGINISSFAKGQYFVKVNTDKGFEVKKLIKE